MTRFVLANMYISITNALGDIYTVQVNPTDTLLTFKQRASELLGISPVEMQVSYNGQALTLDQQTLQQIGILPDDIVLITQRQPTQQLQGNPSMDPRIEALRQQLLTNPALGNSLFATHPALRQAMHQPMEFHRMFLDIQRQILASQQASTSVDALDVETQKRIEQEIKRANIAQNLENAMEYTPESFGRVVMLYVDVKVNGIPIKAFVDSGAQATIMSPALAEKCHLMHLVDERFAGVAHGVGTAKILGRIHSAPMQIGNLFLPCSFTIMENKGVEFLLGLDMLRRHQACIDLSKNVLRIGEQEVAFLPEHEIPASDRFSNEALQSPSSNEPSQQMQQPAASSKAPYPEESIKTMMGLGVTREEAIRALDMTQGDATLAASLLFP